MEKTTLSAFGPTVEEARLRWGKIFGPGSVAELCARYRERLPELAAASADASAWADAATELRVRVEGEHRARYRAAALAAEFAEEQDRAAAAGGDAGWVAYEAKWRLKLSKLQRAYPERWRVPGLSEEEVRDTLTLRLIEVVTGERAELSKYQRAGREWGMCCVLQHLRTLRKSFGLRAIPADFSEAALFEHTPSQEEQWLDVEAGRGRALAEERAELRLSRPQRRWLWALKLSANAGAFFESSAEPNLSAASRVLGKNRSSAQRAYRELQGRFIEELDRLK